MLCLHIHSVGTHLTSQVSAMSSRVMCVCVSVYICKESTVAVPSCMHIWMNVKPTAPSYVLNRARLLFFFDALVILSQAALLRSSDSLYCNSYCVCLRTTVQISVPWLRILEYINWFNSEESCILHEQKSRSLHHMNTTKRKSHNSSTSCCRRHSNESFDPLNEVRWTFDLQSQTAERLFLFLHAGKISFLFFYLKLRSLRCRGSRVATSQFCFQFSFSQFSSE